MGYFDALAGSSFKQVEGRWVFYPWGTLGRGYVVPSQREYLEIRVWVKRYMQVSVPIVILTGLVANWALAVLPLLVACVWYFAKTQSLAKGLDETAERLTISETYRAQAEGHSLWVLWILEASSLAFVVAGVAVLTSNPEERLAAVVAVGFFGACAIAIGFMIVTRMKTPHPPEGRTPLARRTIQGVVVVAGALAAVLAGQVGRDAANSFLTPSARPSSAEMLWRVASELNKNLPMFVDQETELMNVGAVEGTIIYNYRLPNLMLSDLDPASLIAELKPSTTNQACTTPQTRDGFLKNGIVMRYSYVDARRAHIAAFDITPQDCGF